MCLTCLPSNIESDTGSHGAPEVVGAAPDRGLSRRTVFGGSLGLAALGVFASPPGAAAAPGPSAASHKRANSRTRAVLVGTAGGPIWRMADGRRGISTVVEIAGTRYLVDAGHGSSSGMRESGVVGPVDGKNDLTAFRAGFLTHLHSDHVTDLSTFLVHGFIAGGLGSVDAPFTIYGPGDRGAVPTVFPPTRPAPPVFNPSEPTPGTASMVAQLLRAFATDINDRMFDSASPLIDSVMGGSDISLPADITVSYDGPQPRMSPFPVYEDDRVRVTATLVEHGQMVPSFGFRFDSDEGSIVISGDTTLSENLMELADGCDILLHEVLDEATINANIDALSVPESVKEAFRNHMFGAHTTEQQLIDLVGQTQVRTLVLHHFVPTALAIPNGWDKAARRIQKAARGTEVLAGLDGMIVGV